MSEMEKVYRAGLGVLEVEQEKDGRWLAEITGLPGVLGYGTTSEEAVANVFRLAAKVAAENLK